MTEQIIQKLTDEIEKGITSEAEVVYILAGIRKIIERDDLQEDYPNLNFHCDWVLHAQLDRRPAKELLIKFDKAQPFLKDGLQLHELPPEIRLPIWDAFMFESFEEELSNFCDKYGLPDIAAGVDEWAYFLYLYARIIEDIPMVVKGSASPKEKKPQIDTPDNIIKVVVHVELAKGVQEFPKGRRDQFFKISWEIVDKNGYSGALYSINSFPV